LPWLQPTERLDNGRIRLVRENRDRARQTKVDE
jgi:hypothetical protein